MRTIEATSKEEGKIMGLLQLFPYPLDAFKISSFLVRPVVSPPVKFPIHILVIGHISGSIIRIDIGWEMFGF